MALVGDVDEEVAATGQVEAAIVGHYGRESVPLLGCLVGGEEFGGWVSRGGALLRECILRLPNFTQTLVWSGKLLLQGQNKPHHCIHHRHHLNLPPDQNLSKLNSHALRHFRPGSK